mmetsp:Transcript_19340/g.30838  ORF Transcript_19340/g.30838 Transcript_19340/m.30838 type:complete len:265 (+) Transcript_19340:958-1752(+)
MGSMLECTCCTSRQCPCVATPSDGQQKWLLTPAICIATPALPAASTACARGRASGNIQPSRPRPVSTTTCTLSTSTDSAAFKAAAADTTHASCHTEGWISSAAITGASHGLLQYKTRRGTDMLPCLSARASSSESTPSQSAPPSWRALAAGTRPCPNAFPFITPHNCTPFLRRRRNLCALLDTIPPSTSTQDSSLACAALSWRAGAVGYHGSGMCVLAGVCVSGEARSSTVSAPQIVSCASAAICGSGWLDARHAAEHASGALL